MFFHDHDDKGLLLYDVWHDLKLTQFLEFGPICK